MGQNRDLWLRKSGKYMTIWVGYSVPASEMTVTEFQRRYSHSAVEYGFLLCNSVEKVWFTFMINLVTLEANEKREINSLIAEREWMTN